jgi:hypothetical protein
MSSGGRDPAQQLPASCSDRLGDADTQPLCPVQSTEGVETHVLLIDVHDCQSDATQIK